MSAFITRLKGSALNGDNFTGTGEQLVLILEKLSSFVPQHIWYTAAIDATGPWPEDLSGYANKVHRIGSVESLQQFALGINQFIFGVFLALPPEAEPLDLQMAIFGDDSEGTLYGVADVVIRAFDTDYFEVSSRVRRPIEAMVQSFGGLVDIVSPE